MKMEDIIKNIEMLSHSQGFYSRFYNQIMDIKENDTEVYENIKNELESYNFKDVIDMVLFFEC